MPRYHTKQNEHYYSINAKYEVYLLALKSYSHHPPATSSAPSHLPTSTTSPLSHALQLPLLPPQIPLSLPQPFPPIIYHCQ